MKVTLNKTYPMNGPVDSAWQCLSDIEKVAGCMPGAQITEKVDDENFKGKVKVKLGPVTMEFSGDIKVDSIEADQHKIHLIATGKDNKGTSSASMDLTAFIKPSEADGCELQGDADVTVNGKLANFGGRMMTQVADQILGQFADNFSKLLATATPASAADGDSRSDSHSTSTAAEAETVSSNTANEINGLKIAWNVLIGFFKSFFTKAG